MAKSIWPPSSWTEAATPIHLVGPVYYVGGAELTSYLITGDQGHILVNVGMAENVELVANSIKALGFSPKDIKFILNTQAHFDHAGGINGMVERTGAQVMVGSKDMPALISGGLNDFAFADEFRFKPIDPKNVNAVFDQEVIKLGSLYLKTLATPGHTPGSSSWLLQFTEGDQVVKVLFQSSLTIPQQVNLDNNQLYPDLPEDYRQTQQLLAVIETDYVMTDHIIHVRPEQFGTEVEIDPNWFKGRKALDNQLQSAADRLRKKTSKPIDN